MKKVVLILVVAVVASAMANPVKNNEGVVSNEEHPRIVRASPTHPAFDRYQTRYRPTSPYDEYYGTLRIGTPSRTYDRPRVYYQQYERPGITYRFIRKPTTVYHEQLGFNLYGTPIVYSSEYHV